MEDGAATIIIQPLGAVRQRDVAAVRRALGSRFNLRIETAWTLAMPKSAYYAPRHRYRAEKLLTFLGKHLRPNTKVIGLCAVDISTTKGKIKDWGIFGLGSLAGVSCIVSTHRLATQKDLTNVAIHEVGHTFGLPHCTTHGCVMEDAQGTIKTVRQETGRFCPSCARRLSSVLLR